MVNFKEWFGKIYFEVFDIHSNSGEDIQFTKTPIPQFDEENAQKECEKNINIEDYYEHYDSAEEDPNFRAGERLEKWRSRNPKPKLTNYDSEEEYKEELESWELELEEEENDYENSLNRWAKEQAGKRDDAQDNYDSAISSCVEEKRIDFEKFNKDETDEHYYNFTSGGDNFELKIQEVDIIPKIKMITDIGHLAKQEEKEFRQILSGIYSVYFEGPKKTKPTNKNSGYIEVYGKLLGGIKKFVQTHDVRGLEFSPADIGMAGVYDRFVKSFLSKYYVPVNREIFLRKDVIKQIADGGFIKKDRKEFGKTVMAGRNDYKSSVEENRKKKLYEKFIAPRLGNVLGMVVQIKMPVNAMGIPFIIVKINKFENGETLLKCVGLTSSRKIDVYPYDIAPPTKEQMDLIRSNPYNFLNSLNNMFNLNLEPNNIRPYDNSLSPR